MPVAECLLQRADIRHMGQNAQFDLAVIEADQHLALGRDECLADAPSLFAAHGNVLQIWIA